MSSRGIRASASADWPRPLTRWPLPVLFAVVAGLAMLVIYAELPGRPLILHSLQKLAHPVVFGVIALMLFTIRRRVRPTGGPLGDYLPAFAIALALGFATELGQVVTHRDPALRDVLLDVRGIAFALALLSAVDPRRRQDKLGRVLRRLLMLIAALIAALSLAPVCWTAAAYGHRSLVSPTLFRPQHSLDLLLVSLTDVAPEITPLPVAFAHTPGERALHVPLTTRPYAGVTLDEPAADWRGHSALTLDLTNASHGELTLHLRVQDRQSDGTLGDRFEMPLSLPGMARTQVSVALDRIEHGPTGRRLDMSHIASVTLYKSGGDGPRELWLGTVALQ